jgi:nicotinamidase-related amidase
VTTDVCVLSTVKDAIDGGYDVLLVKDGCAAASYSISETVMESVQLEGGIAGCVAEMKDVIQAVKERESAEKQ